MCYPLFEYDDLESLDIILNIQFFIHLFYSQHRFSDILCHSKATEIYPKDFHFTKSRKADLAQSKYHVYFNCWQTKTRQNVFEENKLSSLMQGPARTL